MSRVGGAARIAALACMAATAASAGTGAAIAALESQVAVSIAPTLLWRSVTYRDRLTPALAGYSSGAAPGLRLGAEVYPLSRSGLPVLSDLGLVGSYGRSLRQRTLTSDGSASFDGLHLEWEAGLRWRSQLGSPGGPFQAALLLSYGSLRDDFSGPALAGTLLPGGTRQSWRPGLEARVHLARVDLDAGAGWLAVVSRNHLLRAFPRASESGVDLRLGAASSFEGVEARLGLRYARFFSSLHPLPHDPYVAGGALDEQLALDLAITLRL